MYNTTISACGRARDFTSALALLREMDARGVAPSVVTYSAAITAAGHAGEWRAGLELKAEMEARGVAPNAFTCVAARPNKQTARARARPSSLSFADRCCLLPQHAPPRAVAHRAR